MSVFSFSFFLQSVVPISGLAFAGFALDRILFSLFSSGEKAVSFGIFFVVGLILLLQTTTPIAHKRFDFSLANISLFFCAQEKMSGGNKCYFSFATSSIILGFVTARLAFTCVV